MKSSTQDPVRPPAMTESEAGDLRHASVTVFDPDAAKYQATIFIHDWTNMAEPCAAAKKAAASNPWKS